MTDTQTQTLGYTLGIWTPDVGTAGTPMFGVEYALDRESRFDWFNEAANRTEAVATTQRRHAEGSHMNTYTALVGWTFSPDAPEEEEDTSREAQARAIATMRARVTTVEEEGNRLRYSLSSAQRQLDAREQELRNVWAALMEEAETRDWCSEFETFHADNNGDEWLTIEREIEVNVTFTLTVGRNFDEGDTNAVADEVYEMDRYPLREAFQNATIS